MPLFKCQAAAHGRPAWFDLAAAKHRAQFADARFVGVETLQRLDLVGDGGAGSPLPCSRQTVATFSCPTFSGGTLNMPMPPPCRRRPSCRPCRRPCSDSGCRHRCRWCCGLLTVWHLPAWASTGHAQSLRTTSLQGLVRLFFDQHPALRRILRDQTLPQCRPAIAENISTLLIRGVVVSYFRPGFAYTSAANTDDCGSAPPRRPST